MYEDLQSEFKELKQVKQMLFISNSNHWTGITSKRWYQPSWQALGSALTGTRKLRRACRWHIGLGAILCITNNDHMTELWGWQNSGHCLFPGKSSIASWQIFGVTNKKREVGWHEAADLKTSSDSITLAPLGKDKLPHDFVFHLSLLHPAAMAQLEPCTRWAWWVQGEERALFLKSSFYCRNPSPSSQGPHGERHGGSWN